MFRSRNIRNTDTPVESPESDNLPRQSLTKSKPVAKQKRVHRYALPSHLAGNVLRLHIPFLRQAISDRLAIILPYGKDTTVYAHQKSLRRVANRLKRALEAEECSFKCVHRPRYRHNIQLPLPSNPKRSVLIQIEATQAARQNGDIRMEMNPAWMTTQDVSHLHQFMRRLLGKDMYRQLMAQALVNVWHPAADIEHLHLDHVLVNVAKAMTRTAFEKMFDAAEDAHSVETGASISGDSGRISGTVLARRSSIAGTIEGYNFGSERSDYFTSVYSKNIEMVHRAVENIARAGRLKKKPLLENAIKQLKRAKDAPPRLRIEVRGRKMNGVPLWALSKLTNRFKSIHFVDLADPACVPALPPGIRAACIALYRDSGRNAVYAAFDGSKYLKAIQAWLDSTNEPEWWQPELYWQAAIDDLRRKKIFPPEAWDADGRDWRPQPKPRPRVRNSKSRAITKIDKRTVTRR